MKWVRMNLFLDMNNNLQFIKYTKAVYDIALDTGKCLGTIFVATAPCQGLLLQSSLTIYAYAKTPQQH